MQRFLKILAHLLFKSERRFKFFGRWAPSKMTVLKLMLLLLEIQQSICGGTMYRAPIDKLLTGALQQGTLSRAV
jgi:hypothetical protein